MKRLLKSVPSAAFGLAASIGFALGGGVFLLLEASALARIVDRAFLGGSPLAPLLPLFGVLLGWIVLRSLLQMLADGMAMKAAIRIKSGLRLQLIRHAARLGPSLTKGERSGELIGTVTEGVEQLETYVAKYIPQAVLSVFLPAAALCVVLSLDVVSAIILAVTFPLLIMFMILVGVAAKRKADRQFKALGMLSGHFFEVMRGLTTLRIFNRSKAQLEIIAAMSEQYRSATLSALRLAFLSALVMELFATLGTAIAAVFLGLRLISGEIEFYRAFYVLLLVPEFYAPIRMLGVQYHAGMNGVAAAKRIMKVLDMPVLSDQPLRSVETDIRRKEKSNAAACGRKGFRIEFDRVTVHYPGDEHPVLKDISFTIEPGERIAVVGRTGAGKSTLLDLIQGFVIPSSGTIRIDGTDLHEIGAEAWRSQLTVVPQRTHLFSGTIADNLRLGAPAAEQEELEEAARLARAEAFISRLPDGYDTELSEKLKFSGGQIQRLGIARALTRNAAVALFDEPVSQLDMENATEVSRALERWSAGRTVVWSTHHLDTAQRADRILVLHQGRLAETGTHRELMDLRGIYREMWESSFRKEERAEERMETRTEARTG
ncbi:thiol reductant ABC exporter subunit CydD [Paenibacillus beijingensis]|uniref:ABC transporter ATP-binding protein n=1 Tax=Paenibacillus beijingensis TaxID=1126833 RepID=A0A0D5NJF0_9BACL|nr:thiol reductant ABC exporter subunit CydD [Paenibacillus beijingensis]AJY75504.1 hypothetical protein VN24_14195 [Paenibacillus beijingensis]